MRAALVVLALLAPALGKTYSKHPLSSLAMRRAAAPAAPTVLSQGRGWRVLQHVEAGPQHCDPSYECRFYAKTFGLEFDFDFSGLCSPVDYQITDALNHTYYFNICGFANQKCNPSWETIYNYGVAVQSWGSPPPCNQTGAPVCTDDNGNPTCCTANCEVLGVQQPEWDFVNPQSPVYGGIIARHISVPEGTSDPYMCDIDPKTGGRIPRSVTYVFTCDQNLPPNAVNVSDAYENTTCQYVIEMSTAAACGCLRTCYQRDCGDDSCGGTCGTCPQNQQCIEGICCQPDCRGRQCGSDGCGGSCGTCNNGYACSVIQQCTPGCIDQCAGRTCGPNGCGGSCGSCAENHVCNSAQACEYVGPTGNAAGAFFGGLFTAIGACCVGLAIYGYRSHGDALHSFRGVSTDPRNWCQRGSGTGTGSTSSSTSSSGASATTSIASAASRGGYGAVGGTDL